MNIVEIPMLGILIIENKTHIFIKAHWRGVGNVEKQSKVPACKKIET